MTHWLVIITVAVLVGILIFTIAWTARGYNHPI